MASSNNNTKELSFNEFLHEEAIKPVPEVEVALELIKEETISYKFPLPALVAEEDVSRQWRTVRNYFRTGIHPEEGRHPALMPVLLAPYLVNKELNTDYPVFLSENDREAHCSFSDLLDDSFNHSFRPGEAEILFRNLPRLAASVKEKVERAGNFCPLTEALEPAVKELSALKVSGEEGAGYLKDLEKFKDNFPKEGWLSGFSRQTPVHMFTHLLKYQFTSEKKSFIAQVHNLRAGLQDLITIETVKHTKDRTLDFAGDFIEFSKLDTLMPESASEDIPKDRLGRIVNSIQVLDTAENVLLDQKGVVFLGKELAENPGFAWNELLEGFEVQIAPENESCLSAAAGYKKHIAALAELMAAARIAELEIRNKYDEEVHGDFFARFNWHYFTDEEMAICPPVILIEYAHQLLDRELPHFSALIASTKPVKILAVHFPAPVKIDEEGNDIDELLSFQQELSALAISQRSAFTLQGAVHDPLHMLKGMAAGLSAATPALFHILFSPEIHTAFTKNFLDISTAVEGRQFPLFSYNANGEKWGSRFDLNANPQPFHDWPIYSFEVNVHPDSHSGEMEKLDLSFTFADYFAVNAENSKKLLLVSPQYWTDDLVALGEYLDLSADNLYSKVPYIWLVDDENTLHKAVVPYTLVLEAKERLDFWNFIQELGGVNSFHVEQAVIRTRQELQEQNEKEIAELEDRYEKQIEEVREVAAEEAMNNLAGILLDLDSLISSPGPRAVESPVPGKSPSPGNREIKEPETATMPGAAETSEAISSEPWIETYRCTSCNECTDKYPRAFKYNSEKQAYVEDPTTVTFAQIVKAAEACPAKCIHPGIPLNPNEPGLEELMARAKKFN